MLCQPKMAKHQRPAKLFLSYLFYCTMHIACRESKHTGSQSIICATNIISQLGYAHMLKFFAYKHYACVSLVQFKNSVLLFRFFHLFSLPSFRYASTKIFFASKRMKGNTFFASKVTKLFTFASNFLFRFNKYFFAHYFASLFLHQKNFFSNFASFVFDWKYIFQHFLAEA